MFGSIMWEKGHHTALSDRESQLGKEQQRYLDDPLSLYQKHTERQKYVALEPIALRSMNQDATK
ncbi:hypothetical protein [Vibrio variabilis]|uniref:hypothetical protein n=1 Tax=Vibrio variabilis TaxID=990271 RepID=UPI001EFA146C|nr:hypothetical protein [Vibrio variabilis]